MIYLPAGVRHLEQGKYTWNKQTSDKSFSNEYVDEIFFFPPPFLLTTKQTDAFNGLSMVGHLKLAYLDLKNQSFNSFVFRGLRNVQVRVLAL